MTSLFLLRFQTPMLAMLPRMVQRGVGLTATRPASAIEPVTHHIAPLSDQLVDHYLQWCGAPARYAETLPPHLVAHWGLPIATQLLLQTPFPLTKVLNQGVTIRVHGKIPRREALVCRGSVLKINENNENNSDRIRMTVQLLTGTVTQPNLVETELHMVFIRSKSTSGKKPAARENTETWHTTGSWQAAKHDGMQFALLTGDFNPIHWIGLVGRMSTLGSKVLHGFGSFARTFEQLDQERIKEIDMRFLRPVPLPSSQLSVEQTTTTPEGKSNLRLIDSQGKHYLAGTVTFTP